MSNKTKLILGLVAFVLFLGIAYTAYSSLSEKYEASQDAQVLGQQETSQEPGDTIIQEDKALASESSGDPIAPDFTVSGTDGQEYKLSDFRGKPVVLNFWASWCPPCRQEMPHFNDVYGEYKNEVAFLMVDLVDGQRETEESGLNFVKEQGYDFPIYLDKSNQAASIYGISGIPTTLFFDAEGYIFTGYQGPLKQSTLETVLKSML